ncbi:MAG: dihydroorotate dehydrogenase [Deltaproteobacteria bacterium]|nr:dihydroorotate dehydrogenase [Deltaproteobacteria bacterium]MBW2015778.1 dihydroorotate dehydrogenase [Deltaproteobacteria bacterium]MBW2128662.1 dihydroorotate dehydrogenase [Deltaproteobacteria bacterium]MBW2302641.1 dihydroorotate dehydrogenase [Deltaproteobacteria bacterium]
MDPFKPDLSVKLGPLVLKNPVMTASGTFGYGKEYQPLVDLDRLGAVVVKGLSLEPRAGNPPPRIVETPCGMLNAIGLANMGIEAFLKDMLPRLRGLDTHVVTNIYGHHVEEYGELASALKGVEGVSALEVNVSCPNVEEGGMAFGVDPEMTARVTGKVVESTDKPVIVKLSPNVTDIREIARAAEGAGAHALSLINTLTGMAIDIESRTPVLANVSGGLSGPAIRPVALYMVYQAAKAVKIPVIGIGGIMDYRDALQFLIAGASAIQVGTANFVDPLATVHILEGLTAYCVERRVESIKELIGTLRTGKRSERGR